MISRRDLFKGTGAFLGAATAYKASESGVFLPYDKIITEPIPPWAGRTQVIAFEGQVSSFDVTMNHADPVMASISGRMLDAPMILDYTFGMEFYGDNMPPQNLLLSPRIYVQIFQRMD